MVEHWIEELHLGFRCFRLPGPANFELLSVKDLLTIQEKTRIVLGMQDRALHSKRIVEALIKNNYQGIVKALPDAGHDLALTHTRDIVEVMD